MLANLDAQLASGAMDQHTYDARKLEVQELIRKGQAFVYSPVEKTARLVGNLLLGLIGFGLFLMAAAGQAVPGVLLGLAVFGLCSWQFGRALRH